MPTSTQSAPALTPAHTITPRPQDPPTASRRARLGRLLLTGQGVLAVLVAVALLGALTACSNGNDASGGASAGQNAADVIFATNMIPHHAQAIEMADVALAQARSPEVVDLATAIKQAQQPEIDTMAGWLEAWKEPVPDTESLSGMDHGMSGGGGMSGMDGMQGLMSAADLRRLSATTGRAFDSMWLSMMVQHHEGAIAMARTEIAEGTFGGATSLARDIITAQRAEIRTMNRLLDKLSN